MPFGRQVITVEEARNRISRHLYPGSTEEVALTECVGRRLAEDVVASYPVPHFTRSGMDGFAVRTADLQQALRQSPVILEVIENIPCGAVPVRSILPGTCSRIMTGAAVPEGADAVVMLEMTESLQQKDKDFVILKRPISPGENIAEVGTETPEGTLLLEKGRLIRAGEMALLAFFGYAKVKVYRRPQVAVFATGSELLNPDEPLQPGKIRNSNSYMLAAQILDAGGVPVLMGTIPDEREKAEQIILQAFDSADLVITTGGVSVGDYDILAEIVTSWDGELLFNKVGMRPGSPTTAGVYKDRFLFALSGNPGACFVGFELFVRPVLWHLQGKKEIFLPEVQAFLAEDFGKTDGFRRYVRGRTYVQDGKLFVRPLGPDKSSVMMTIKDADCLIVFPSGTGRMAAGEQVSVVKLHNVE